MQEAYSTYLLNFISFLSFTNRKLLRKIKKKQEIILIPLQLLPSSLVPFRFASLILFFSPLFSYLVTKYHVLLFGLGNTFDSTNRSTVPRMRPRSDPKRNTNGDAYIPGTHASPRKETKTNKTKRKWTLEQRDYISPFYQPTTAPPLLATAMSCLPGIYYRVLSIVPLFSRVRFSFDDDPSVFEGPLAYFPLPAITSFI